MLSQQPAYSKARPSLTMISSIGKSSPRRHLSDQRAHPIAPLRNHLTRPALLYVSYTIFGYKQTQLNPITSSQAVSGVRLAVTHLTYIALVNCLRSPLLFQLCINWTTYTLIEGPFPSFDNKSSVSLSVATKIDMPCLCHRSCIRECTESKSAA